MNKTTKISLGIIAFTKINNKIKYLIICRRSSLNYMAFLMGKYDMNNISYINKLFSLMSNNEKKNILKYDFDYLWYDLWNNKNTKNYKYEKNKFNKFKKKYDIKHIININGSKWDSPEWGFPKGRKENNETYKECAFREFYEETGYNIKYLNLINNIIPFNEYVIGSNNKLYKHKYFLAYFNPKHINNYKIQEVEVSKLKWVTYEECLEHIRNYSYEKIKIIKKINNLLNNYKIII